MEYTVTWHIKGLQFLRNNFSSPYFVVEAFNKTEFYLSISKLNSNYSSQYNVTLCGSEAHLFGVPMDPNITLDITNLSLAGYIVRGTPEYFYKTAVNKRSVQIQAITPHSYPKVKLVCSVTKGSGVYVNVGRCTIETELNSSGVVVKNVKEVQRDDNVMSHCNQPAMPTLQQDILLMYREGILCDKELKTETKSFPVHACVLSARSPVFRAMFTTNMKEKKDKIVPLPDLDEATVSSMLNFIYQDKVDKLQWKSAVNLYSAADQYQILPLKVKCSDFLKNNILVNNACEALVLADMCQDKDLKVKVQKFIKGNKKEILNSECWKKLEKEHNPLSLETLRAILLEE